MKIEEKIQELEKKIESLKKEVQKEEEMEQWFKSLLNGLEIEINDNAPYSVFYIKNSKLFFELFQNLEIKHLWVDYGLVWNVLEKKYKLNHDEIKVFIKSMVEKHLKLGEVTPYISSIYYI